MSRISFFIMLLIISTKGFTTCTGINCTCNISATAVAFGAYNPLSGSNVDSTGDIAVTCSALIAGLNVSYDITLSQGSSGSFSPRAMTNGGNQLQYNLYTNAARSLIWGNGSSGTSIVSDAYILNVISTTRHYTTYGRIPGSQNVPPGSYSDSIIATVIF